MIPTAALLALGVACTALGPFALRSKPWQVARPALALRIWFGLFTIGCLCFAGSVVAAVAAAAAQADGSGHGLIPTLTVLVGWVVLAVVGAVISLVGHQAQPVLDGGRLSDVQLTLLVARDQIDSYDMSGHEVLLVHNQRPFALSCRHRSRIIVSSALADALAPDQLRAVIEHEIAHLDERHGPMRKIAVVAGSLAPWARCGRDFAGSVNLLTELAADDRAADICGRPALIAALSRCAELTGDEALRLRARRLGVATARSQHGSQPQHRAVPEQEHG
jgi:Zn-dependent protease with chaperone function